MIIFGGTDQTSVHADGAAYDPTTDVWRPIAARSPSEGTCYAFAGWTGSDLILSGGLPDGRTAARYAPATDRWTAYDRGGAPAARASPAGVVTENMLLVFGGFAADATGNVTAVPGGGRLDLESGTWAPLSSGLMLEPRALSGAARFENELVVWGGHGRRKRGNALFRLPVGSGARDPSRAPALGGGPSPRFKHTWVATDRELFVFGGASDESYATVHGDGASLDLASERWAPMPPASAPSPRADHAAAFTGAELVVWGGWSGSIALGDGARFDAEGRRWRPMSRVEAPTPRSLHTATWTGREVVIFGGYDGREYLDTGARCDPALDRWKPLPSENAPRARAQHSAVWTGKELIVFGGFNGTLLSSGACYDPELDRWLPLPNVGAPSARALHSAMWSGSQMVIFGGLSSVSPQRVLGDGARYDPAIDAWLPLPTARAPAAHASLWKESAVVLFGGLGENFSLLAVGAMLDL